MRYRKFQLVFMMATLVLSSMPVASGAQADTTVWRSVAMACVPTSSTLDLKRHSTVAGRVKHKPGRLGIISFVCPIEDEGFTTRRTYQLQAYLKRVLNHPLPKEYAWAQLRGVDNRTGHTFTILDTRYGTDVLSSSDPIVRVWSEPEYIGWNNDITYYVQLTIRRQQIRRASGVEQIPSMVTVELIEN